ncbi:MAG: glutamate racemase [Alphaproteobacteria bacterium]|nr:glutamate racemase [Alphaproteobacteria bacterium]
MANTELPIGVFDSGVGGLTVLSALSRRLPRERLLYLGDTARVPYGARAAGTIQRYSASIASHLVERGIKALVIACNTATAHALPLLQAAGDKLGLPVVGVIEPGVKAALRATRAARVGVIATEGTIRSGPYQRLLEQAGAQVWGVACPLFVALAEEGWLDDEVTRLVAERYLAALRGGPDTLILGCTHYPLLRRVIQDALPGIRIVDSADATAAVTERVLAERGLLRVEGEGHAHYLVTDNLPRFITVGERFLGQAPHPIELVDLGPARPPFLVP